jgi:hypothetical protein
MQIQFSLKWLISYNIKIFLAVVALFMFSIYLKECWEFPDFGTHYLVGESVIHLSHEYSGQRSWHYWSYVYKVRLWWQWLLRNSPVIVCIWNGFDRHSDTVRRVNFDNFDSRCKRIISFENIWKRNIGTDYPENDKLLLLLLLIIIIIIIIIIIQFIELLLFVCRVSSYKANYRHSSVDTGNYIKGNAM